MEENEKFEDICTQGKIVEKLKELKKNDFFRRDFHEKSELYSTGNLSDIFACERKVVFRRLSSEHYPSMLNNKESYFKEKHNIFVKQKWASIFKESPRVKLIDTDVLVVDKNFSIHGYLDCAIKIGEVIIATNIRSLNSKDFQRMKKEGASRKDISYTLLCMCLTETSRGLIIYENNDTQESEFFEIKPDTVLVKAMFNEIEKINKLVKIKKIPPKPYTKISKECEMCFFKERCWEKKGDKHV